MLLLECSSLDLLVVVADAATDAAAGAPGLLWDYRCCRCCNWCSWLLFLACWSFDLLVAVAAVIAVAAADSAAFAACLLWDTSMARP